MMKRTRTMSYNPSFKEERDMTAQASIPSHVYLNLSIINSDVGDATSITPQQAVFSEMRNTPIIENAADYEMSVVRFSANGIGRLLPLYVPVMKTLDETIYSVTVSGFAGASPVQVYLKWRPEFQNAVKPYSPNDLTSFYYYGRTYTHFCGLFNDALWAALNVGVPVDPTASTWNVLRYIPGSSLFELHLPASFFWGAGGAVPSKYLYFNNPLGLLLANFPVLVQNTLQNASGMEYLLDTRGLATTTVTQDFPSTGDVWSPIDTYVFTSSTLPLIVEQGTAPIVVGTDNTGTGQGQSVQSGFQSILTDFVPGVSGGAEDAITSIVYTPTSEYRMVSPSSTGPVQRIDVALWWRYRLTGALIPVYLPSMASLSMKILFRARWWHSGQT